jgi:arylsulfatase A-like enzyme
MTGLAHRGWTLNDYGQHIVHTLRRAGYWSGLVGEQHLSLDPETLGYDRVMDVDTNHADTVAPAAIELLRDAPPEPFFVSIGFFETHREFFEPSSVRDALYSLPPTNLPDTPATRRDMASFKASARSLDQGVGAVLNALDELELAENTVVVLTTDHGLPFPGAKATLTDRGIGVLLILRGPGFYGGRVIDGLISQIDLYPTLCEVAGIDAPPFVQGRSMLPLVSGERREINELIFAELTYHAAYEPQRAVRDGRYKLIRRYGGRTRPVLANIDDGPSKSLLLELGLAERRVRPEALHDLAFDPGERDNVVDDPAYAEVLAAMRERLDLWMLETDDPLLLGPVPPPPGATVTDVDQVSPSEHVVP